MRWHDGAPFTAHDVLFTYQVMVDPKTPTAYSGDYKQVKEARVLDDYTFQVTYPQPFAPALGSWGLAILPKHLLAGQEISRSPLGRQPIGTGPFRFRSWRTQDRIILAANPDYFAGRPYFNGYIFMVKPDQATIFLELKAGNIDRMGLTPLQYRRQTEYRRFRERFNKYRYTAFAYTYLGYNLEHPKFQDRRVRQALTSAINKQEIIDGVLLGLGTAATGPYKPGTWFYNPEAPLSPTIRPGPGVVRGRRLAPQRCRRFWRRMASPLRSPSDQSGNEVRIRVAEIIQRRLKEIGIQVQIRTVEWAAFLKEFIDKGRFDAVLLGWTTGQDPDLYDIWHSSKTKPGELNFIHYRNPEVDALLEEGRHTFDQEKRKRCYFRLQEILAEDQPYTFLFVPDALPAVSSRVFGIKPAPAGIDYNFPEWYVPRPLQKYTFSPE